VLIAIVQELLPYGSDGWASVSSQYRDASEEEDFRDPKDLKDHWVRKLCNNFKKPTGKTGEPGDRIHRCQEIDRMINSNNEARVMGASSGDEAELEDGYVSSGMEDAVSFTRGDDEHGDETNAEGGVVSVNTTTTQQSIPRRPTSRPSSTTGSSSGGKTKNSSNRDRQSVAKSIQSLTSVMSDRMTSGGNNEMVGFATMQLQMMQQSQMQMQMQLQEMKEQGKQSLKFLKVIATQGKNKKRKGKNLSSSSSSSSDDDGEAN
jgi:hypothetical protein